MIETAYAKINLALHVRGQRDDGYHELETLFAFVDCGDVLTAHQSERDKLRTVGEFAPQLTDPFDNIVSRALTALPHDRGLDVVLEKNLPVAAGLGGGSADAGAVFRLIRESYGLPDDWHRKAATLGADVPACVDSVTCIGRGTGTELEPVDSDLTGMSCLLVNPRVPLSTRDVFAMWDGVDHGPIPQGRVSDIAEHGRNDLEPAALAKCPKIAIVLERLRATEPFIARMSGSGATCFALYRSHDVMRNAAEKLASEHPDWWQMNGRLR
ncbi:MAG: 4-(cytidine 5'-diphospho)-2-C-methyl-D-erythritol kinase [Pontixanthobacter sp.]